MIKQTLTLYISMLVGITAFATEYEVGQKDMQFTKKSLTIKVGDTVNFTNQDQIFHNVFSLSELKTFDLGSYPKGEHKSVTFEKAGTVDVECSIHPNMQMKIKVE